MDEERIPRDFDKYLRGMRIVVVALVMGVVTFAVITLFTSGEAKPDRQPVVAFIGLVFAAITLVAREVAPKVIVTSVRKKIANGSWPSPQQAASPILKDATTEEKFLLIYQSRLIVRAGLLEGAAFLNLIMFTIDHQWWSFAIAAVFAAINLSTFPSRDGLLNWIDQQVELLALEQTNS
ncbi:MAG: hypothetical protein HQ518_00365 [Rhodopirellula sp.]|nr:hypothetical protein [Rhodopirellula sp.]